MSGNTSNIQTEFNVLNKLLQKQKLIDKKYNIPSTYIQLDSSFRDRNNYNSQFDYTINIKENTTPNEICNSYPLYNFQGVNNRLLGSEIDPSGNDTQYILGSEPQVKFGGSGNTTNIFGSGNNIIPNLDGKLYSSSDVPYSSTINNYYNGLSINRYNNQKGVSVNINNWDQNGSYPNESTNINKYNSFSVVNKNYYNGKNKLSIDNNFIKSYDTDQEENFRHLKLYLINDIYKAELQWNIFIGSSGTTSLYNQNQTLLENISNTNTSYTYYNDDITNYLEEPLIKSPPQSMYIKCQVKLQYKINDNDIGDATENIAEFEDDDFIRKLEYNPVNNLSKDANDRLSSPHFTFTCVNKSNSGFGPIGTTQFYARLFLNDLVKSNEGFYHFNAKCNLNINSQQMIITGYDLNNKNEPFIVSTDIDTNTTVFTDSNPFLKIGRNFDFDNGQLIDLIEIGNSELHEVDLYLPVGDYRFYRVDNHVNQNKDPPIIIAGLGFILKYADTGETLTRYPTRILDVNSYTGFLTGEHAFSVVKNNDINGLLGWNKDNYWSINEGSVLNVSNPQEIVIHGGSNIDNFYKDYWLEDTTLPLSTIPGQNGNYDLSLHVNRFKKILKYDRITKKATLCDEDNRVGFLAENKNTGRSIEDNDFANMNINGDWANTIAWWRHDQQNDGTLAVENGLLLNGNDQFVNIHPTTTLFDNPNFTIQLWCYFNSNKRQILFNVNFGDNSVDQMQIVLDNNRFQFTIKKSTDTDTKSIESNENSFILNKLMHIVVTYNLGNYNIYIDGQDQTNRSDLMEELTINSPVTNDDIIKQNDYQIGFGIPENQNNVFLYGYIREFAIWNTGFDQTNITNLYNDGEPISANILPTNLQGYWKFNGTLQDYSSNNNDAILYQLTLQYITNDKTDEYPNNTGQNNDILQITSPVYETSIISTTELIKHNGSQELGGSSGWIPQDRYRIRKSLPHVMGWGFNEDRNGARPRTGRYSNITGNVTGGDDIENLNTGIVSEVNFTDFSGTGPTSGKDGAVFEFEIINPGKNFKVNTNNVYSNQRDINHTINNLFIEITQVDSIGAIQQARVAWPGSGFKIGENIIIYNGGDNDATIQITQIGQSIDISNGFLGKTTGNLSHAYGEYDNDYIYIPSKGPESNNAQERTQYNLTGYMNTIDPKTSNKNPEFINNYPVRSGETGVRKITKYITSNALYVTLNPLVNINWKLTNPDSEPSYSESSASLSNNNTNLCASNGIGIIVIGGEGYDTPVSGHKYDGSYSRVTYQSQYNRLPRDGYQNSYNWEILRSDKNGDQHLIKSQDINTKKLKIRLNHVILPNVELKNKIASHISDLSYIYVQINNQEENSNKLISNNPNSKHILFKVSINNIFNAKTKKFICLKGDQQIHTINFGTDQDIHVKILCPDGEILKLSTQDKILPQPIDPELQTNVLFEIIE